ncbi:PspC domain protein [Corynebacterium guangdongense]|uniref:Phage shock protein PspC (Stress-responsive transcriptional regulator) n=2 Tax=Corynebacterium guangdongense TaxID=1783348 RepID=A0ABU1ZVW9_9CORY|nr:phage shock protein PspC (stress-responsive transcriptional regulator) [Corynebacterium guangdongense]WJZ17646.1 PspC domain protein [Corynebacterium guangdongense]
MTYRSAYDNIDSNSINDDFTVKPQSAGARLQNMLGRRLTRSTTDNWVGGVLSGIGETYGINTTLLRVLFIASLMLPGPQVLLYLVAWLIMPTN